MELVFLLSTFSSAGIPAIEESEYYVSWSTRKFSASSMCVCLGPRKDWIHSHQPNSGVGKLMDDEVLLVNLAGDLL